MLSLSDATYRAWTQPRAGYNKLFHTNSYGWRFSTVNNAVVKYRNYCDEFGITKPTSDLRIVVRNNWNGGAAPMLGHTYGLVGFNTHSSVSNFFLNTSGITVAVNIVHWLLRFAAPDIIIGGNSSQGTASVYTTTFHEMAHASHFTKVGSSYWSRYISYIITYGAYGDGSGRNAGYCALGEAWGYHMGHFLTIEEFGADNSAYPKSTYENFNPRNRPFNPIYRNEDWIPKGLMKDIIDNNRDEIRSGYYDDVSGYTNENIYNALDRDVRSPQEFRDRLLRENNDKDKTDLRNLFTAYYWE